jgi:hypothetical protein
MPELKYGIVKNEQVALIVAAPMGASEIIPAGGAFVKNDASGRMEIAGDGSTLLAGYVFPNQLDVGQKYQTCSSTEGGTVVPFIPISAMLGVAVKLPVTGGNYVATMLGETADLEVVSNAQGVQLDASAEDTVIIIAGDVENNTVTVIPNPDKIASLTGVV